MRRPVKRKLSIANNCGKEMSIKAGRFGPFLACSGYPDCQTTRRLVEGTRKAMQPDEPLEEKCTLCGEHLIKKHGRFGEFIGCSGYPKCKYTRPITMGNQMPEVQRRRICAARERGNAVDADVREFSTVARVTRIAISRRRSCRCRSRVRSAPHRLSWKRIENRNRMDVY